MRITRGQALTVLKDLLAKETDSCLIWPGGKSTNGYGVIGFQGKTRYVHLVAWEILTDTKVPSGKQLDHTCRVHSCVNIRHLEPVTQRENILRGTSPVAVRAAKTHCIRGHLFDLVNTYHRPDREYGRNCRKCRVENQRGSI